MSSESSLVNEQILSLLENATSRIAAATDSLSLAQLHSRPERDDGPQMTCLPTCVHVPTFGETA